MNGQPPKHFLLGPRIVQDPRLSTQEARVGRYGPAYFCPSIAYFGGDIDTVLVRPKLALPSFAGLLSEIGRSAGYECSISDKGIYAKECLEKWGSLSQLGTYIRGEGGRALLDKYLDKSKSGDEDGVYLSDRRRYLNFATVNTLVGEGASAVIDELIVRGILYRGLILQCSVCRNADWFSMTELSQQFTCKRCGRLQTYTRLNWKKPDEPSWFYKLDEIVYQAYQHGVGVTILALDSLRGTAESFTFAHETEFWLPETDSARPYIEVDILCSRDGILTIGEAKTENRLGKNLAEEKATVARYFKLANDIAARQIVFATLSQEWATSTIAAIEATFGGSFTSVRYLVQRDLLKNR